MNESTAAATLWSPKEKQCISLLLQHQQQKRGWSTARNPLLQIHAFILRHALDSNLSLLTKFISACSEPTPASDPLAGIRHARRVFDNRRSQDAFLCNSMIRAYLQNCQFRESVYLYRSLRREGCFAPDNYTFPFLVKSCASNLAVEVGQQLHNQVIKMGIYFDVYVSTAMVDMYAKFGKVESSRRVFDEMPHKSPASWTAIIVGYARSGDVEVARELFEWMPNKDPASFNAMIDAVAKLGNMVLARQLFDEMPERNVISWTSMISGYCKNGNLDAARCLFDSMPEKNLFSWNVMIGGYCQNKQPHPALELFRQMQFDSSLQPDEVTAVSIIPAIADLGALDLGCWIHSYVRRKRLDRSSSVLTALIDMYAKCGEIQKAQQVFHKMPQKQVASWNAMINGFAINGRAREALEVFLEMLSGGVKPNEVTMIGVLSACSHGGLVEEGKNWFSAMVEYGIDRRIEHYGCMVDLLGRAGHVEEAEELIERMPCEVNGIVLSSLLFACGCHGDVRRAERVMRKALELEPWNVGNHVMVRNMYAGERRWEDMSEVKGMMRRNGAKKEQLASHGLFDVQVKARGDIHIDDHHTNEDVALAIGTALLQALGDRKGIKRFGDFSAPLDEALVRVSLDLSGRPHLSYDLNIPTETVGTYDTLLVEHFFQSLVNTSGMTLHIRQLAGKNSHHIIEATFKAFARTL